MAAQRGSEITCLSLETRVPDDVALNSRNPHSRAEAATKEEMEFQMRVEESFTCAPNLDCAVNLQTVFWKPRLALLPFSPGQRQRPPHLQVP